MWIYVQKKYDFWASVYMDDFSSLNEKTIPKICKSSFKTPVIASLAELLMYLTSN